MKYNDKYDIESWEEDYNLLEKKDLNGLLKLREIRAKSQPNNLYVQREYAEALNLNKRYNDTIEFITPLYNNNYKVGFGIQEIIDALYGLGKTEMDFNWKRKPKILKLDLDTLKLCIELVSLKRKSVSVSEIYFDLIVNADYCNFNEQELGQYLVKFTNTFDIQSNDNFIEDSKLKIRKE